MPEGGKSDESPVKFPERIWDSHVHCYPSEVIADPLGWARKQKEPHWARLVSEGPQGWADPEGLIRKMDACGVEKVLLQAWYWENPETARLQNAWHAEWLHQFPDRLLASAAVHPDLPDPESVLNEAKEWGACAVGECLPQVQSPRGWQDLSWSTILEWTTRHKWPVCLHVTEPVGHSYPGRIETSLMELIDLLEARPRQRWIFAHWGGGLPFHSLNRRVGKALSNVWFDTAASPLLYDARIWRIASDLVGPDKILLGSDFPLRLYPRLEAEPGWNRLFSEMTRSGLTEEELNRIAHRNLASLLDLA